MWDRMSELFFSVGLDNWKQSSFNSMENMNSVIVGYMFMLIAYISESHVSNITCQYISWVNLPFPHPKHPNWPTFRVNKRGSNVPHSEENLRISLLLDQQNGHITYNLNPPSAHANFLVMFGGMWSFLPWKCQENNQLRRQIKVYIQIDIVKNPGYCANSCSEEPEEWTQFFAHGLCFFNDCSSETYQVAPVLAAISTGGRGRRSGMADQLDSLKRNFCFSVLNPSPSLFL